MKLKNKYKKTIQRIVSFTAAVAMVLTSMPMNEVSKEAGDLFLHIYLQEQRVNWML